MILSRDELIRILSNVRRRVTLFAATDYGIRTILRLDYVPYAYLRGPPGYPS